MLSPIITASRSRSLTRKFRAGLILWLVITFFSACERQPSSSNQPDRSLIKIGYYGDLSGPTFNFGESAKNGVLMAAEDINQAGGINGRRVDVVIEDDQGSPERAATRASKLIDQDKVIAVIAGGTSGNSRAGAPKAQVANIPLIAPSATDPAVTQIGDYVFRACFIDAFQGEVMAKFAVNTLKARKAAILLDFNSPYSRGLSDFFELSFTRLGGQIVDKQLYTISDGDYRGQLNSIRLAAPDVIYIPGYYGNVALIAKQARKIGITQPLLGGDGWDAPELWDLGGDSLNGSYISNHYSADDPSPPIQTFVREYKQRYGNLLPDAHAALAYDAMRVLIDAIQRAGTTEGPKLREALAQTKSFPGVTGIITINEERNAIKPAVVLQLQDRKYIYQETIQPETTAAAGASPTTAPNRAKKPK
ncbi:MAG: putative branched chain amino acid transporter, periplasmic amino acid-binding protein [Acidobacteria bacterium]|nr:putative branched chain amino acid transporter, periplasmic amino acid-binding protein [Acidobacteriota bacterium]